MDYKTQIERGIELLVLCQKLQSEKDGVDRADPLAVDKSRVLDQFAQDISNAITNMSALHKLIPQMLSLAELGRKLRAQGKITVDYGEDYSQAVIAFIRAQHELE